MRMGHIKKRDRRILKDIFGAWYGLCLNLFLHLCFKSIFSKVSLYQFGIYRLDIASQARTKLVCAVLSLPVPSKSSNPGAEPASSQMSRSVPDYIERRTLQKLLLVGYSGSGTSTIFKQVLQNGEMRFPNQYCNSVYVRTYVSN